MRETKVNCYDVLSFQFMAAGKRIREGLIMGTRKRMWWKLGKSSYQLSIISHRLLGKKPFRSPPLLHAIISESVM